MHAFVALASSIPFDLRPRPMPTFASFPFDAKLEKNIRLVYRVVVMSIIFVPTAALGLLCASHRGPRCCGVTAHVLLKERRKVGKQTDVVGGRNLWEGRLAWYRALRALSVRECNFLYVCNTKRRGKR